jgi:HSP20 family protein
MASVNNPTQTQTEANQQAAARARAQPEGGNGGRSSGQQAETRERSDDRQSGRGNRALSRPQGRQDLVREASNNPLALMWQLSREMDRMMASVFGSGLAPLFGSNLSRPNQGRGDDWSSAALLTPRIDVEQRNDSIVVRADLPGVRKEDVQIDVTDDVLTISGERREEREEGGDDQDYRAIERSYGSFYTTVPLPEGANTEKLTAKMHDGVLEITVPLDESARPRRIQIQD